MLLKIELTAEQNNLSSTSHMVLRQLIPYSKTSTFKSSNPSELINLIETDQSTTFIQLQVVPYVQGQFVYYFAIRFFTDIFPIINNKFNNLTKLCD